MRLSQYVLLIILFVLIIFLLLRPKNHKKDRCPFKLLREPIYKDVRIDCETGEPSLCPKWCPTFDVLKQKCVHTNPEPDDPHKICPPGTWGNVKHPYDCRSFFMCVPHAAIQLFCSDNFCFDGRTCAEMGDGVCAAPCTDECKNCCVTERT
nr:maco-A 43 [Mamestra configurata nucleopolyhedrovirus A]